MSSQTEILTRVNCRICFIKCPIDATNVSDIAKIFYELSGHRILSSDIPQKVCNQCLENISIVQNFKETCDKSEKFLEELRNISVEFIKVELDETTVHEDSFKEIGKYQVNFKSEVKDEDSDNIDLPLKKSRKKGLRATTLSWDFFALETHLQQNLTQPSDYHAFILKFDLTRPKPGQLPPNKDLEEYETVETASLSCTFCSFKGVGLQAKKKILNHCKKNCGGKMFRCPCNKEMYCLDILRHHIALKHKPKRRVLFDPLQCNFCQFTCCYESAMERHCKKMHEEETRKGEMCIKCGEIFYCDDLKLQHIVFRCNSGDKSVQIFKFLSNVFLVKIFRFLFPQTPSFRELSVKCVAKR